MGFLDTIRQIRSYLREEGRVSLRALRLEHCSARPRSSLPRADETRIAKPETIPSVHTSNAFQFPSAKRDQRELGLNGVGPLAIFDDISVRRHCLLASERLIGFGRQAN